MKNKEHNDEISHIERQRIQKLLYTGVMRNLLTKIKEEKRQSDLSSQKLPIKDCVCTISLGVKFTPHNCSAKKGVPKSDDGFIDTCPNRCGACLENINAGKLMGKRFLYEKVLDVEKFHEISRKLF